jgi:hypothetical protein
MRNFTARLLELNDDGYFNKDILIQDLLNYLSEDEVKNFVQRSDFIGFEDLGFISSDSEEDEKDYDDAESDDDNALEEEFA